MNDEMVKQENLDSKKKNKKRIYLNYYQRLSIMILFLILILFMAFSFLNFSFRNIAANEVNYSESGNLDYRVFLKENDFYEESYLKSGMAYIANLINKIDVDFNYAFKIDKKINASFYYDIVGKLVITDSTEENVFFSKEYVLLDKQSDSIENSDRFDINKTVQINYDYYNKLAQKFKNSYGVDAISNLIITLKVNKLTEKSYDNFNGVKEISLKVPLTQRAVKILLEPVKVGNNKEILNDSKIEIKNIFTLILSILLFILSLIIAFIIIKYILLIIPKHNKYQKTVNRILKSYDRLIANVRTLPDFNQYNVIKVEKFSELVDIRDNLKLPIMYFEVAKGEKCYFYIEYCKKIYLLTLKAIDMENNNEK